MTTQPALSEQKRTYLDILAILHFVHGGLMAFVIVVMVALLAGFGGLSVVFPRRGLDGFGCFEVTILVAVFGMVAGYAALNLLVGFWLRRRRGWMATIVVSAINALNVPLGTLLGVFTIVVLSGDEVRSAFEHRSAQVRSAPRHD